MTEIKRLGRCDHTYASTTEASTATGLCPECEDHLYGILPDLHGTPKQVDWALSIRRNLLGNLGEATARKLDPRQAPDTLTAVTRELAAQATAAWWIDHRIDSTNDLLQAVR